VRPNKCMKLASRLAALASVAGELYREAGASAAKAPACSLCTMR
jgi:hypothetical protein